MSYQIVFWGPKILAGDAVVSDMRIKTNVMENELTIDITDQNQFDKKIVLPLNQDMEYETANYQNAAVTVDKASQQLVIDWLSNRPKQVQLKFKVAKVGQYQLKLQTVRNNLAVESETVVAKVLPEEDYERINRSIARGMTVNGNDVYSLRGTTMDRLTAADLSNNVLKPVESFHYPANSGVYNNDLSYYNGKLYTFFTGPGTFTIWNADGTHTVSKPYTQAMGKIMVSTMSADGQFYGVYGTNSGFSLSKLDINTGAFSE